MLAVQANPNIAGHESRIKHEYQAAKPDITRAASRSEIVFARRRSLQASDAVKSTEEDEVTKVDKSAALTLDELNQGANGQLALRDAVGHHGKLMQKGKNIFERIAWTKLRMMQTILAMCHHAKIIHLIRKEISSDITISRLSSDYIVLSNAMETSVSPLGRYLEALFNHMKTLETGDETAKVKQAKRLYEYIQEARKWANDTGIWKCAQGHANDKCLVCRQCRRQAYYILQALQEVENLSQ